MRPTSGSVEAVAFWVQQAFVEDFGQHGSQFADGAAKTITENDISLRVFRSLTSDDISQLFTTMSFGQKRTIKLLVQQANQAVLSTPPAKALASGSNPDTPVTPTPPPISHRPSRPSNGSSRDEHAALGSLPRFQSDGAEKTPTPNPGQASLDTPTTAIRPPPSRKCPTPSSDYSRDESMTERGSQQSPPCCNPEENPSTGKFARDIPTTLSLPSPSHRCAGTPRDSTRDEPMPPRPSRLLSDDDDDDDISPANVNEPASPIAARIHQTSPHNRNTPSASQSSPNRPSAIPSSPRPPPNDLIAASPRKRRKTMQSSLMRGLKITKPSSNDFLVCIVGPSGVGKSSALNAVLDGHQVLPTSSMRASTAVPIEIRYKETKNRCNDQDEHDSDSEELPFETMRDHEISQFLTTQVSEDKRFLAEIDFIFEEHWKDLLNKSISLLQRRAKDRQELARVMSQNGGDNDEQTRKAAMEAYCCSEINENPAEVAALAAVRAVLGERFSTMQDAKNLCEKPKIVAILKHLGQSLTFSFDKSRDVSMRIERFLATSTNRRSAAVWPLVKSARIYGPWKMLSGGMVLVDLPGLQDANSARNQVVSSYIQRCHAVISAAKISRARDNKTTHDLLTGPIRLGIEQGRVSFVGFIATHCDDVKPSEIVDDLDSSFSENFRLGLRQAGIPDYEHSIPTIQGIKDQVSRLAVLRSSSHNLARSGISDSECLANNQSEIEELSKNLRSECIVARNGFVGGALEDQFKQEMESIRGTIIPTFKVFCVSSTQYTSIMRNCEDVSRDFTHIRFTGISALCDSLWSLSKTTQSVRDQGRCDTTAAFRPSRSDEMTDDEPEIENREELRDFLQSVLQESRADGADAEKIRADMEKMTRESAAAREAELSDAEKKLQSRSVYLKEVICLNEKAAGVLLTFLNRCKSSSVSIASDRRIDIWLDQAKEHTKETKAKGAMIAILGDSGSGKSSLLNALLDSDGNDVLPVSGVRACTAAPIAITYRGTGGYEAEIEFLERDEWHDELRQLISDLEEATKTNFKHRMSSFECPRSELGRAAYDKIMSVYGKIASYHALTEETGVVEHRLGTRAKLHDYSAKGIRQQLERFCSSKSDASPTRRGRWGEDLGKLWPLVRIAHLRGPFKLLSDSGGCLLDLPGLQDSNAARNTVVQSYLGSCSGFLIAAPIKRAVDNQTARELLGRQFRRQLLLDGRIGSVAFAATQTDDIDALQVASELGLHGVSSYSGVPESEVNSKFSTHAVKISQLRKRIKVLSKKKTSLSSRLKRENTGLENVRELFHMTDALDYEDDVRKREERVKNLEGKMLEVQDTISGLTSELAKREHVLNNICSLARNEYCRIQVREDFVEGIQEITDYAIATDQAAGPEGPPQLPVFTTSSNDFRHLNQKQTEHAKTFYTADDTGVPKVFQFIRHNMLISRINAESRRSERLAVLLSSLSQYLLMERRATASQQASLMSDVEGILKGIDKDVKELSSQAMDQLNRILLDGPMKKTLILGGVKGRESASVNILKVEDSVHWATYRACLRRFGVYVSPTSGAMNVNEALMAPLMETVIPSWREAFGTGVSKILQTFIANATTLADSTLAAVAKKVSASGLSAAPLEGAGELRLIAKKSFDMALSEARMLTEKEFEDLQRNCWQELPLSVVQRAIRAGYIKANDESGPGCVARLKNHMRCEVRHRRSVMFDRCVKHINRSVKKVLNRVSELTSSMLKTYFVGLLDDIEVLWDSQCDLSHRKCGRLANTLKDLTRLVDKVGIATLALKKSTDGVDFDSIDSARSVLPVLKDTLELASRPLLDENVIDSIIPEVGEGYWSGHPGAYWAKVKQENQIKQENELLYHSEM